MMYMDELTFATLFLGFCALVAPYVGEVYHQTLLAPNLRFLFKQDSPHCHKTTYANGDPVYYFRFEISNSYETKSVFRRVSHATNCEAVLENMWKYDSSGSPIKIKNFTPVNLNMGPLFLGPMRFIDLNLSRSVFCDIGHINKQDPRFYFDVLVHYNAQREYEYLEPGERCILQYGVYSGNSSHKEQYYNVSWSGKWDDETEKMFRELVITPTNNPEEP